MKIPLLDLTVQYPQIRDEVLPLIEECCRTQQFILGKHVSNLEKEIASYCGVPYAVGVASGTDALLISLMALDVGPGDEVITPPFTFFATAGTVARLGAKPVFVDIDPTNFNIAPLIVSKAITPKTKAVIPVHLYGLCVDMATLKNAVGNIPIVEDACQAIGSEFNGKRAGSFGITGCFSFYPSKNLGGFGDGGMAICLDEELYQKIRLLRVHGAEKTYYHDIIGGNFRLDELQAAVLRVKLKYLDQWIDGRRRIAKLYEELFSLAGLTDNPIKLPLEPNGYRHSYHQYVIRTPKRDELSRYLSAEGIGNNIYYPIPLHLQKCFAYLGYKEGDFPVAEQASKEVLALPVYPELTTQMLQTIVDCIGRFFH